MGLREFVELFDKNEVKNLFNALSLCIEYVRIDLHVFAYDIQRIYERSGL